MTEQTNVIPREAKRSRRMTEQTNVIPREAKRSRRMTEQTNVIPREAKRSRGMTEQTNVYSARSEAESQNPPDSCRQGAEEASMKIESLEIDHGGSLRCEHRQRRLVGPIR